MKASEAARIRELLADRHPPVIYEEAAIEGVRMLVIIGKDVDTVIRFSRGLFFRRTDMVEMYRIKDYVLTRPFIFQVFRIMDLTLKTTDPENPIVWLRGIPLSNLVDTIREHVQETRQHNRIYEIN